MAYVHLKFYMLQLHFNIYIRLHFSWTAWRWRWKHWVFRTSRSACLTTKLQFPEDWHLAISVTQKGVQSIVS